MREHMYYIKSIALSALLFTGFTAGSIAQDTATNVNPEKKAPVVLTTTPNDGEENVNLSSVFEITFNSEMDETTINGTTLLLHATTADSMHEMHSEMMQGDQIKDKSAMKDSEKSWQNNTDAVNGTISYSNKVAVFTPDEELKEGTQYTFTVTNGVKSSENVALENEENWSFTTTGSTDSAYSDNLDERSSMEGTENKNKKVTENKEGNKNKEVTENKEETQHMERSENMEGNENRSMYATSANRSPDGKKMIDLGKAGQFVILAKTNINNESESRITGRTGEGSVADSKKKEKKDSDSAQQTTSDQTVEMQANQSETTTPDVTEAIEDMMSAYNVELMSAFNNTSMKNRDTDTSMQNGDEASSDDVTTHEDGSFHSNDLSPGVHEWNESLNIESDVNLSGAEDDVWVIKVGNNLTVQEDIVFTLSDGAQAENVYWYVEGEVTIGENAQFEGIILSMNDITLEKGAKLNGRMFSQTSVNLDDNTVTEPRRLTGQTTSTNE